VILTRNGHYFRIPPCNGDGLCSVAVGTEVLNIIWINFRPYSVSVLRLVLGKLNTLLRC
jgi:hypothetical protein